jgi:hypothetical protein
MWQPKCHRSVQASWISKCRHWLPVGDAKVTETRQNWINYNQSVSECRVHQMCRIQMPTETNDFAHQDSTHKLGKMGKLNCKHAAFCLGFVYSEGSRMWRGAQIPSFMRFCLCLALRSLHAQPYTSFEHIRIWGPMEWHMWPCCGLSNLCKGVTWEGGMNTSSHLVVLKRIEVHLTYHFHSSLLLITHNLQTFPITPYKSEPSTL